MSSKLNKILSYAVKNGASDAHLTVGSPPAVRIDGDIRFIEADPLTPEDTVGFVDELLIDLEKKKKFFETGDMDIAHGVPGLGRFRVNILMQRGSVGIVMRHVKGKILDFEALYLPEQLKSIADMQRGLVLITGTTGSGKSTTLASIIDWINQRKRFHIITLEDPIEFLHSNKRSIITQREVSIDTQDFKKALHGPHPRHVPARPALPGAQPDFAAIKGVDCPASRAARRRQGPRAGRRNPDEQPGGVLAHP
ncbi:MAG: Flp pilus assembly complex ATPase component TadA [Candidatus Hydrogenedentes bacterium]|nr:Flp pilus assembly complex ATPase component TadA [Candidatus Hydrogenedentota bacterium]